MSRSAVRFGAFQLDPVNRRLLQDGTTVELNARYLDALILLVEAGGELVAKDRFMDEVWRGVPVTDEALTQAIRTLRRTLGDHVSAPRYIETVPKHGYRFIAAINDVKEPVLAIERNDGASRLRFLHLTRTGIGAAMAAGAVVGMLYGLIGAADLRSGGGGAVSLLLVLVLVSMLSAGVAGAGIAAGLAASRFVHPQRPTWTVAGGAIGGLIVGAFANLIGSDAFRVLFGHDIGAFAGAGEGLLLGAAAGLGTSVTHPKSPRSWGAAALIGVGAGLVVALLGGRMMAGSLESLVSAFPSSQFRLNGIGRAVGESGLGPIGTGLSAAFEGAVFTLALAWAGNTNPNKPDRTYNG